MSTPPATWSAGQWWCVRMTLRAAMLRVLLAEALHLHRQHPEWSPVRSRHARLWLLAWWRRQWREGLRAFEKALVETGGRKAPGMAEIRAHTADLVPLEKRRKCAPRQRKNEAGT